MEEASSFECSYLQDRAIWYCTLYGDCIDCNVYEAIYDRRPAEFLPGKVMNG